MPDSYGGEPGIIYRSLAASAKDCDDDADEDKVSNGDTGKDAGGGGGEVGGSHETTDGGVSSPTGDENQSGNDGDENGLLIFGDCGVLGHFLTSRRIGL